MLARFFEVGMDDILGIGFRFSLGQPHLPRRPFAEQPVAAGDDAELEFLVASELGFESTLAVVELCHRVPLAFPTRVTGEIGCGAARSNAMP